MLKAVLAGACALFLALPSVGSAQVYFTDGNQLLEDCSVPERDPEHAAADARCIAYVVGVNDGFVAASLVAGIARDEPDDVQVELLCVPTGVTTGDLQDLVVQYLKDTPEKLHLPAGTLVWLAIAGKYRC